MRPFSFEKLNVWQKSKELASKIYEVTKKKSDEEKFGLTSQMQKYSISISSNIAEGTGRHSNKDKVRFTEIGYGFTLELLNQSILSMDKKFLNNNHYENIREQLTEILTMLNGLYKSQLNT